MDTINNYNREAVKALPESSSATDEPASINIQYNIFNRYNPNFEALCRKGFKSDRSYEQPDHTYYIVLFPKKDDHVDNGLLKIEKAIRTKLKYKRILITREIDASRIHYNVLVTTSTCPMCIKGKSVATNYTTNSIQKLYQIKDINEVIHYMSKEANRRPMNPGEDKFIYIKE